MQSGQLKPGEDTRITGARGEDGRLLTHGLVAIMDINGRLLRIIIEQNPSHECYVEQDYPIDWMYPHLTPHRLNHEA